MLNIEVLDNGKGGHDDIIITIEGLTEELTLDSYWLIVGTNCQTFQDVKNSIAHLLISWESDILNNAQNSKTIYLALDISDEYIGCIRVIKSGEFLNLTYGFTQERDLINSLNTITDFSTGDKSIIVNQDEFLNNLNSQVNKLKNTANNTDLNAD